jgi:hypothetical protein
MCLALKSRGEHNVPGHFIEFTIQYHHIHYIKIVFSGKSLTNKLDDQLSHLNLKPGSKVMLIGKKPSSLDDQALEILKNIENVLSKHEKKLSNVTMELDGVHRVSAYWGKVLFLRILRSWIGICRDDILGDKGVCRCGSMVPVTFDRGAVTLNLKFPSAMYLLNE